MESHKDNHARPFLAIVRCRLVITLCLYHIWIPKSKITNSLVSEGCRIYGTVENSVLSGGVIVEEGAIVKDSVIMDDVHIQKDARVFTSIIDADAVVEAGVTVGKDGAGKDEIAVIATGSVVTASKEA